MCNNLIQLNWFYEILSFRDFVKFFSIHQFIEFSNIEENSSLFVVFFLKQKSENFFGEEQFLFLITFLLSRKNVVLYTIKIKNVIVKIQTK